MTPPPNPQQPDLCRALLERLQPIRKPATAGTHVHGAQLFSYCALARERLLAIRLEHPLIGVVLRGEKEVWLGDRCERFGPGMSFSLPAGLPLDVVNIPGGAEGIYESLIFEVRGLPPGIAPLPAVGGAAPPGFGIALTRDRVEALGHAGTAIADPRGAETLKALRLAELLAVLRDAPAARHLFRRSLAEEVAGLVASDPSGAWTAERLAACLGTGTSTLRRRLAREGLGLRGIIRDVRLSVARERLRAGSSSLAAAEAAGYSSRSHFARRFREAFGRTPSGR